MPEGDTIFRAARTLNLALAGKIVVKFETQLPLLARIDEDSPIAGRTIESVEAQGKWMHIRFSGDLTLLTHMLMSGSWHIYRTGERWQRPRVQMRVAIFTNDFVAVAFNVQVAEFHTSETLRRHESLRRLGPDVLSKVFDEAAAAARLQARPDLETGVALLSQSILAGVGNVFKSEVCFASRVNPFRKVASLTAEEMRSLIANARKYMSASTIGSRPNRVYHRAGEPCVECGTAIVSRKQGLDSRVTFWCPRCQP